MIARLTGLIDELKPTSIVLDVNGVGYELTIPLTTYDRINTSENATLHVQTIHREDQFRLFGFATVREKSLFNILISISGIGPSMAISIISSLPPDRITEAVKTGNSALLVKVPGIGKTKAEKIIFELTRKISSLEEISGPVNESPLPSQDAVEALIALGFDESKAKKSVADVISGKPDLTTEDLIKESLKILV